MRNVLETILGAVVLVIAIGFFAFAYTRSGIQTQGGYPIIAKFDSADGITSGSDVKIGGVKVGIVRDIMLEENTYRAKVTMEMKDSVKIPTDSSASITAEGLLGSKYLSLAPGADDKMLDAGGEVKFTQSSVNLETLIGKFMFSGGGVEKEGAAHEAPKTDVAPKLEETPAAPAAVDTAPTLSVP